MKRTLLLSLLVGLTPLALAQPFLGETLTLPTAAGTVQTSGGEVRFSYGAATVLTPTAVSVLPNPLVPDSPNRVLGTAYALGRPGIAFASRKSVTLGIHYDPAL